MKRIRAEKMEEVLNRNVICKFCQNKDSCDMAEDSIIFCTKFKRVRTPIEHLVDFYECKKGHRFGVNHTNNGFRKNSIPCPVCRNSAFFREMVKFGV